MGLSEEVLRSRSRSQIHHRTPCFFMNTLHNKNLSYYAKKVIAYASISC